MTGDATMREDSEPRGHRILNISGPYAVGKDSIINALLAEFGERLHRVSTVTTRPVSKEADPSYTHLDEDEFSRLTSAKHWIVNRQLTGHTAYATSLQEIAQASDAGLVCIHSIYPGPAGAGALRQALGSELYSVGLLPPGVDVDEQLRILRERLVGRGRDDRSAIDRRLAGQVETLTYLSDNPTVATVNGKQHVFDEIVVNKDLSKTVEHFVEMFRRVFG